jgi:DNA polymerase III epsilon subunit-like protein
VTDRSVYFDLETGGVEPHHPDIQLAAIAIEESTGREVEAIEMKLAFDPARAEPEALAINHWTAEAWERAVSPQLAVLRFRSFLEAHATLQLMSKRGRPYRVARLVGHNAATFDGPRLQRLFAHHKVWMPADLRVRCTCQRALWWFDERPEVARPENFQLATLCRYFGIPVAESHEALADVRLTIQLARSLATHTEVSHG